MPNQASSNKIHRELMRARIKAGMMRALSTVGSISAVAATGWFGWRVGSELNRKFFRFGVNLDSSENALLATQTMRLVYGGAQSCFAADAGDPGGAQLCIPAGTWTLWWSLEGGSEDNTEEDSPNAPECHFPLPGIPAMNRITSAQNCAAPDPDEPMQQHRYYTSDPLGTGIRMLPMEDYVPAQHDPWVSRITTGGLSNRPYATDRLAVENELTANPQDYPTLLQWYGSQFHPDQFEDPTLNPIPDCTGVSLNVCIQLLQDAGYGVTISHTNTFEEVPEPMPAGQPAVVTSTQPGAGSRVATDTQILINVNPEEELMPRTVPAPLAREHKSAYEARLAALDLSALHATLSPELADPARGPEEAVTTQPAPGSRAHKNDPITVRSNPPDWPVPAPGGGGGGCESWVQPGINFAPLASVGILDVFPFAVPFWVFEALDAWVGTPVTPAWDFHFPFAGAGDNWHVSLEMFDPHMPAIRAVLLVASLIAMAWFFLSLAVGAPSNRQQGAE